MDQLHATLYQTFGFNEFRPGQEAIIRTLLDGRDALVVMPTGSGKSLCFQLPALMFEGMTLVVSPLIALMKDQVDALRARRIPAAYINSSLSAEETTSILKRMRRGAYKLLYVAPERFRNPRFLEALRETQLSMLAIDEAHCISAWGHDFRPDYLHLGEIVAQLDASVRILAVTATATDAVQEDIIANLALGQHGRAPQATFITGFARPNLSLNVTRVRSHMEKLERLLTVIEFFRTGIVYCSTRKMVDRVKQLLADHNIKALTYNGAMGD
ncbi:MAG: RecQ family ATP-dependent DNA helicase, partial [bacterium]|nr:RecQ family ATP-dependent DNA helicase [bacterium]